MTSTKQISANQKNAFKSTGPKTTEGKSAIALNAMKHGLLSKEVLLPDEDEKTLVEFGKRLRSQLQPIGELETLLADRIVASTWRLRRILVLEIDIFEKNKVNFNTTQKPFPNSTAMKPPLKKVYTRHSMSFNVSRLPEMKAMILFHHKWLMWISPLPPSLNKNGFVW
jgi:hypothetical protein